MNNITVKDGNSSDQVVKTTETAGVHVPHHNVDNFPTNLAKEAKQDDLITALTTLLGYSDGQETLLANILAKIIAAPATEAKQDALNAKDFATQTTLAALNAKFPAIVTEIPADDTDSDAVAVRALPMHTSRISFADNYTNTVDPTWGTVVATGTGMTVNQTGGNLVVTAGTTARAETVIRSLGSWKGGVRLNVRSTLSQRIANNNFFVELVDVIGDGLSYTISSATAMTVTIPSNPFTSINVGQSVYIGVFSGTGTFLSGRYAIASVSANDVTFTVSGFAAGSGTCSIFGWNYYQLLYTGTTATNANFDTQRKGYASGATTATINTTASPGHLATITGNDLKATFSDQLVASATAIAQAVRATRAENVPDDYDLKVQVRVANGSTAPASGTTWTIGYLSVSNYANQDVVLQDVRPMTNAQALPVDILRAVGLTVSSAVLATNNNLVGDVGMQYRASATGAATITNVNSPATPAAQQIKGTAGRLVGGYIHNNSASTRWIKFFNATSASVTPGTTSAAFEIGLSPGQTLEIASEGGLAFATAITIMVTGGQGLTNNTAITANEVTGFTMHA